jgi:hypothetical protein
MSRVVTVAIAMALFQLAFQPSNGQQMNSEAVQLDEKRLTFARGVLAKFGDKIPSEWQSAILAQKVIPGMPPYEASLAAGAYSFEVKADPNVWPPNADPYKVIAAQSMHPDLSEIWCIFATSTQYPGEGMTRFRVHFKNGRAVDIQNLGPPK